MPSSMKFYQDQLVDGGVTDPPLPAAHRLIFVRHGAVIANGRHLGAGDHAYFGEALTIGTDADWSEVWRWEIAPPNEAPTGMTGTGTLSVQKLARVITTLEADPGSTWLFRLDSITSAAGRITPRHRHHGPGIRCLYQGVFDVQDAAHAVGQQTPGDAWWESGVDTVVAWHSTQMPAIFIRGLILPVACKGEMSNIWMSDGPAPKANWRLFLDQEITI